MKIHLIDGTYELFRAYFGAPSARGPDGRETGAVRGLARTLLSLIRNEGATHVGVAFDHVIESFRNELFDGYKTGDGIEPDLLSQFEPAEEMTRALGFVVWPMVEFEADDALATAAHRYSKQKTVSQVLICTPDKDLSQCVRGKQVVCVDRRRVLTRDEPGVTEKFGVKPASIPDWLALVGDQADGIPGVPRWGPASTSRVLAVYGHLERIPAEPSAWSVAVRGASGLSRSLEANREEAALYKELATLRTDVPLAERAADLEWRGARKADLQGLCWDLGDEALMERVPRWIS